MRTLFDSIAVYEKIITNNGTVQFSGKWILVDTYNNLVQPQIIVKYRIVPNSKVRY